MGKLFEGVALLLKMMRRMIIFRTAVLIDIIFRGPTLYGCMLLCYKCCPNMNGQRKEDRRTSQRQKMKAGMI